MLRFPFYSGGLFLGLLMLSVTLACGQSTPTFAPDTLRGALRPARTCYDVTHYALHLTLDIPNQSIGGWVTMTYNRRAAHRQIQLDLAPALEIERIEWHGQALPYERQAGAVFVRFPQPQPDRGVDSLRIYYHGQPQQSHDAPWQDGFVWTTDEDQRPWISVTCASSGASSWWPCKDHPSDEPDSVRISLAVPAPLTCIANGNLRRQYDEGALTRYEWAVTYPINLYNVSFYVGHYVQLQNQWRAKDGSTLPLDYYVLDYNRQRARDHFSQVPAVLTAYEHYLGKYPFWNDGYALVEAPYLGMEHQGAIAYGNRYLRGYLGGMIPRGMDWDYIIVHETGHEYFGNSLSCTDPAELWLHEGFTTYLESCFVEYTYNPQRAIDYLKLQRQNIENKEPIIGPVDVAYQAPYATDLYYKGAWLLHTLRHTIADDMLWWDIFRTFYLTHERSHATTADFLGLLNRRTGADWSAVLDQYLRSTQIPVLEYRFGTDGGQLQVTYRWTNVVAGFTMPVLMGKPGDYRPVSASASWQTITLPNVSTINFRVAEELQLIQTRLLD